VFDLNNGIWRSSIRLTLDNPKDWYICISEPIWV